MPPNELKSICIKNIKAYGLDCDKNRLDFNDENGAGVLPKKMNILVGYNGFGKSSLALALNELETPVKKLTVSDTKLLHNQSSDEDPSIELDCKIDGTRKTLISNSERNEIREVFDIFVINSRLDAKGKGSQFGKATGELTVGDIFISNKKNKVDIEYQYRKIVEEIKKLVGDNITLKNISTNDLTNIKLLNNILPICEKYTKVNKKKEFISNIQNKIDDIDLQNIKKIFFNDLVENEFNLIVLQFILIYKTKTSFKNYINYIQYKSMKIFLQDSIDKLKTFQWEVKITERQDKLYVILPKLNIISNGQRDILVFLSQLFHFYTNFLNSKKEFALLVIDEVFDYLDDANLLVAQYFLINFLNEIDAFDKKVFPMLLTHLDPKYFNNYTFKKPKIFYLSNLKPNINENIKKAIKNRKKIEKENSDFVKFLHFCTQENLDLKATFKDNNIDEKLGERNKFISEIKKEFDNYINKNKYCPISVSLYLRVAIEEHFYHKLSTENDKTTFIETFKTIEKLNFVDLKDISVNDVFYILSPIYNDLAHKSTDTLYYKLQNKTIYKIICDINTQITG